MSSKIKSIIPLTLGVLLATGTAQPVTKATLESAGATDEPREAGKEWLIRSQSDWEQNTDSSLQIDIVKGMAEPTAEVATFTSVLKTFQSKQKADSITIAQSPAWENWESAGNIGPGCTFDSPVFLSLGKNNYWFFARYNRGAEQKAWDRSKGPFTPKEVSLDGYDMPLLTTPIPTQFRAPGGLKPSPYGYHAWQSRDMVNWVHHGPIGDKESRWMTTAEYVDGKAYFYYDYPNDQDPHLIIDDHLTDGEVGKKWEWPSRILPTDQIVLLSETGKVASISFMKTGVLFIPIIISIRPWPDMP